MSKVQIDSLDKTSVVMRVEGVPVLAQFDERYGKPVIDYVGIQLANVDTEEWPREIRSNLRRDIYALLERHRSLIDYLVEQGLAELAMYEEMAREDFA